MDDSNESQNVVQVVKSLLKGFIVSFGSLTRDKEVGSAPGLDEWGGPEESVGGTQYFSIFTTVE